MQRLDLKIPSREAHCHAWLYLPGTGQKAPVVLMAHGLGAIKTMRLDAFAEKFCGAGYACLVFDYRHFGASEGEPRQLLDIQKQLQDWQAAVDFARNSSEFDGSRIVLWGTSFSGGHVLTTAANNNDITAVIAQCPFTDGLASSLAMSPVTSIKVTTRALRDQIGALMGFDPVMVDTSGVPGSTALMTAPDALPGYMNLRPEQNDANFRNEVAARFALQIIRYFPGRKAAKINCPVLFCICETDSVAPSGPTKKYAKRVPKGEIKLYEEGHFDIYAGEAFNKVVRDELDFLKRHVPI